VKVLLDTNAYTALFRGHEGVAARVRRATHDRHFEHVEGLAWIQPDQP